MTSAGGSALPICAVVEGRPAATDREELTRCRPRAGLGLPPAPLLAESAAGGLAPLLLSWRTLSAPASYPDHLRRRRDPPRWIWIHAGVLHHRRTGSARRALPRRWPRPAAPPLLRPVLPVSLPPPAAPSWRGSAARRALAHGRGRLRPFPGGDSTAPASTPPSAPRLLCSLSRAQDDCAGVLCREEKR